VPHFCDVTSNLGFALAAFWGWLRLAPNRDHPDLQPWLGRLPAVPAGLFLTALGSTWYHLAPDNARLVWDRLPIALACGGLLAGVLGDVRRRDSRSHAACWRSRHRQRRLVVFHRPGRRRRSAPYLLLQGLPILLIPLWQWIYKAPAADRLAFGGALAIYIVAKLAELNDHAIAAARPASPATR
jgi:hypothetical protein